VCGVSLLLSSGPRMRRGATEFALCRLIAPGSASTKRCLLLIMPIRRGCAKSERESNNYRKLMMSWVLALLAVMGSKMLLALDFSTVGRTAERAEVRLLRVFSEVVLASPMGMATNSAFLQCFLRAAIRWEYLSDFSAILASQPRSRQKKHFHDEDGACVGSTESGSEE